MAQESAVLVDGWKQLQLAGRQQLPANVRNGLQQGEANVERLRARLRVLARGDAAADKAHSEVRIPMQVQ